VEWFATVWGFCTSALFTGLLAIGLSYPSSCFYKGIDGREHACAGDAKDCFSAAPKNQFGRVEIRCENFLGWNAFADQDTNAVFLAVVAALLVGGAGFLVGSAAKGG
jgi:hypothetical protein